MGSFWCGTNPAHNVGTIHHQKSVGHIDLGRCRTCEAIKNGTTGGVLALAAQH